jgi:glyoxylase-like metal-dependent hydrolase (beta-lactamase superfamily II)
MLKIKTIVVSHFEQNARIIFDTEAKTCCFIDPGADIETLYEASEPETYKAESIFLTHCHIDHGGGVMTLQKLIQEKENRELPLYYHSEDKMLARSIEFSASQYGLPPMYHNIPPATEYVDEWTTFKVGTIEATTHFTPGHAPGHVALSFKAQDTELISKLGTENISAPVLISGDALFKQSIGRTDLPFGDHDTLIQSIKTEFWPLDDATLVLPGHGPNTTIGNEKASNPFLK